MIRSLHENRRHVRLYHVSWGIRPAGHQCGSAGDAGLRPTLAGVLEAEMTAAPAPACVSASPRATGLPWREPIVALDNFSIKAKIALHPPGRR